MRYEKKKKVFFPFCSKKIFFVGFAERGRKFENEIEMIIRRGRTRFDARGRKQPGEDRFSCMSRGIEKVRNMVPLLFFSFVIFLSFFVLIFFFFHFLLG